MSPQNVELVYRCVDAFNRRDLDSAMGFLDEDVEVAQFLTAVEDDYRGHDGFRRWWANVLAVAPDWHVDVIEVRDLGDVTVATTDHRGHTAGVPFETTVWSVARWRDGKVVLWSLHRTQAEALEAAKTS